MKNTKIQKAVNFLIIFIALIYLFSVQNVQAADETTPETLITNEFIGGGTAQGWNGDDDEWNYTLPFSFDFYGVDYTDIKIGSNGVICLDNTEYCDWYPDPDFTDTYGGPTIAPLGIDLKTDENPSNDIYITENTDNVVIRWDAVEYGLTDQINFEVVLYDNGDIKFNYGDFDADPDVSYGAVVGISKGDGVTYTNSAYNGGVSFNQTQTSNWGITALEITSFLPKADSFGVDIDADLQATFDRNIYADTGDISVFKMSDDSIVETFDVGSSNITGWGTDTLNIDLSSDLDYYTEYYVNIDATAIKDVDDNNYEGISYNSTWNFTTEGLNEVTEDIPSCECYVVGSAESSQPENTTLQFSDDEGSTWTYTPISDEDGKDCNITQIRLVYDGDDSSTGEDLEAEFVGDNTNTTEVVSEGDGKIILATDQIGTYTSGSTDYDTAFGVATDNSGNVYYSGEIRNTTDLDPTDGVDNYTPSGTRALYLSRMNANGTYGWSRIIDTLQYATYNGNIIDTDSAGNIYMTSHFIGTVDFDVAGSGDVKSSSGASDIFITKYDSDGTYQWTKTIGGSGLSEMPQDIIVNDVGDMFITGYFYGTVDFDDTAGVDNHTANSGGSSIFVSKYNSDGTYGWTRTATGTAATLNEGIGVGIDSSDNVYLTGYFSSTIDLDGTAGVDNYTATGSGNIFITKYNLDGTYGWSRAFGSSELNYDQGRSITVNDSGEVFASGVFHGTVDFDGTAGVDNISAISNNDLYLTKYNTDGSYEWTVKGDELSSGWWGTALEWYDDGVIMVEENTGTITRYDGLGNVVWSRSASSNIQGRNIAIQGTDVYTVGSFNWTVNFNSTGGTENHGSNGDADIYLTKHSVNGDYGFFIDRYRFSGLYQTQIESTGDLKQWDQFTTTEELAADTDIKYEILDETCTTTLISQTSDSTIDISGINISNTSLCLEITFETTDDQVTSKLDDWQVEYLIETTNTTNLVDYDTLTDAECNLNPAEIPDCECYVLGSAEASQPSNTELNFSDDDEITWTYTPVDNGDGVDCNVTNIRLTPLDITENTGEDLEIELIGNNSGTEIISEDNGKVSLINGAQVGTYTFGGLSYTVGSGESESTIDGDSEGRAVAVDSSGNIYTTGYFRSTTNFDDTGGTDEHTADGLEDLNTFITKYNENGTYGWTRTFAVTSEGNKGIATDSAGDVYVTGDFFGTTNFDDTGGTDNHTSNGSGDVYITKYNSDGSYGWTRTFGDFDGDIGQDITVDSSGGVYVTGRFRGTANFDDTGGSDNQTAEGLTETFITKYNSDGSYGWTRTFGGTSFEEGVEIDVDSSGDAYVVGYFRETVNFDDTGGTDNHTSNGIWDIFITKYNSDGSYGWTRTFGGTSFDWSGGIVVDSSDDIYITGAFYDTVDFDDTGGTDNYTSNGDGDVFITKYGSDGSYYWTRALGGNSEDGGNDISVDGSGDVYVTGLFQNTVNFDSTGGADEHISNGGEDIFIVKYNSDGSYGWSEAFGSSNPERSLGIATDSIENIYITGAFEGAVDFDPTAEEEEHISNGSSDVFLAKYKDNGDYGFFIDGYISSGIYQTQIDSVGELKQWGQFTATEELVADTDIKYEILDQTCTTTLISQTSVATFDLSGIDLSNTALCLEITLETSDGLATSKLDAWQSEYIIENTSTIDSVDYDTQSDPSCNPSTSNPSISIDKNDNDNGDDTQTIDQGDEAEFLITVENDGNVIWETINVTDPDDSDCSRDSDSIKQLISEVYGHEYLDPEESFSYTCIGEKTNDSYISGINVTASNSLGDNVSGDDQTTVLVENSVCGNDIIEDDEECDDGNTTNGDGCSSICVIETIINPSVCGNGNLEESEECDDGNTTNGDGCSSICVIETIINPSVCGNGNLEESEECDDGNTTNGDGCNSVCAIETVDSSICGNDIIEDDEECDDGNTTNGDGCSSICVIETIINPSVCGNDIIEDDEECDDGNTDDDDGCSSKCEDEQFKQPKNINAQFFWGTFNGSGAYGIDDKYNFIFTKGGQSLAESESFLSRSFYDDAYILVTWEDRAKDEFAYVIERSTNGGEFEKLDNLDKNVESYIDRDINPESIYSYRVYTKYSGEKGEKSKKVTVNIGPFRVAPETIEEPSIEVKVEREDEEIEEEPILKPSITEPVKEQLEKEEEKEPIDYQKIVKNTVITAGAASGIYALILSSLLAFPINPLTTSITSAIVRFLAIPFGRKKKKYYQGTAFDAVTKQSVPNLPIQIVDTKTGLVKNTVITNEEGRYGFLPRKGEYKIEINNPNYKLSNQQIRDELYGEIYQGQKIVINNEKEDIVISPSLSLIPPNNFNWKEFAKRKIENEYSKFSIIMNRLSQIIFIAGFIWSAVSVILSPSVVWNWIILVFYVFLAFYQLVGRKEQQKFGEVCKLSDNKPIPFSRLNLKQDDKIKKFAVSDTLGRYLLLSPEGMYNLETKGVFLEGQPYAKEKRVRSVNGVVNDKIKI